MASRILVPFSGARYSQNSERTPDGTISCALCGKPCVFGDGSFAVHVVDGGARYAKVGETGISPGGDMGCFPVGRACAAKLRKAGVWVFEWTEGGGE